MNEALLQKVAEYLDNEMPPDERKAFELQIAENDDLRNYIQLYSTIDTTMKAGHTSSNENKLRQTLQQMNHKYFMGEAAVKKIGYKKWLAIAASVFIVLAVSFYFLFFAKPTGKELYARLAKHDALNIQLRGNAADEPAQSASAAFNKKEYTTALPLLQNYLQTDTADIQIKFSLAVCYMETSRYIDADNIFTNIASGKSAYAATAEWYRALLALKQNNYVKCRAVLSSIPSSSAYFAKAKELLLNLPN